MAALVRNGIDQTWKDHLGLAQRDGINLRDVKIFWQQRGVVPTDDSEDLRRERLGRPRHVPGCVNLGGQRRHADDVRKKCFEFGPQIRVDSHVEDTDIVVGDGRGNHLERQRLRHRHEAEPKMRAGAIRLNE